jgi:4-alpha-glucanotransferase
LKVLRWEREWNTPGHPFRKPADYPAESVAISGTHDTDTLAEWWDGASRRERHLVAGIPGLREAGCDPDAPFDARLRDALLHALFCAGSDIVIVPFQDLFGWRDRVNVPAVVNDENWTWRLPWPIDELLVRPEARERATFLRALTAQCAR